MCKIIVEKLGKHRVGIRNGRLQYAQIASYTGVSATINDDDDGDGDVDAIANECEQGLNKHDSRKCNQ